MRGSKKAYTSLAVIAVTMLLSAALVVPSSNAYAISQNGNNRSGDNNFFSLFFSLFGNFLGNQPSTTSTGDNADTQGDAKGKAVGGGDDNNEQSDRKQLKDQKEDNPHDKDKCKPNKHGKYNKDCTEDQNGQ